MTDTEIIEAIIKYSIWVHPAGGFYQGWTAVASKDMPLAFAWNRPTMRQAVEEVVSQINSIEADANNAHRG